MMRKRPFVSTIAVVLIGLVIHRIWSDLGESHPHRLGIHGGIISPVGRDRFHIEAILEPEGLLRLYTLDRDESQVMDVENQSVTARITFEKGKQGITVQLHPEPQAGDAPGRTSRFLGKLPDEIDDQELRIDVPEFRIRDKRFNLTLALSSAPHVPAMPARVAGDAERELYLRPGGRYTTADIQANGHQVPSRKFIGFKARHDVNPKAGDTLCPVTRTKANPDCTWVIGGRTYQFCCPPCIDEFLKQAKLDE